MADKSKLFKSLQSNVPNHSKLDAQFVMQSNKAQHKSTQDELAYILHRSARSNKIKLTETESIVSPSDLRNELRTIYTSLYDGDKQFRDRTSKLIHSSIQNMQTHKTHKSKPTITPLQNESEFQKPKRRQRRKLKSTDPKNKSILAKKIKVYWPLDSKYYRGVVASINESKSKPFLIRYKDGDKEWLNLKSETFEFYEISSEESDSDTQNGSNSTSVEQSEGDTEDNDMDSVMSDGPQKLRKKSKKSGKKKKKKSKKKRKKKRKHKSKSGSHSHSQSVSVSVDRNETQTQSQILTQTQSQMQIPMPIPMPMHTQIANVSPKIKKKKKSEKDVKMEQKMEVKNTNTNTPEIVNKFEMKQELSMATENTNMNSENVIQNVGTVNENVRNENENKNNNESDTSSPTQQREAMSVESENSNDNNAKDNSKSENENENESPEIVSSDGLIDCNVTVSIDGNRYDGIVQEMNANDGDRMYKIKFMGNIREEEWVLIEQISKHEIIQCSNFKIGDDVSVRENGEWMEVAARVTQIYEGAKGIIVKVTFPEFDEVYNYYNERDVRQSLRIDRE